MAMEMMAGAGAPPMAGPGGGGPPADLAALLGAGGGGADAAQAPAPAPGGEGQDSIEIVGQMLDLGKQYLDVEPDQEDLLLMQKILTQLQQVLAKDQSDADQAMQGSTNPRAMRKAFGG